MTRTHQLTLSFLGAVSLAATAALASGGLDSTSTRLTANLTGANEVPGPGDTDGKGKATFELEAAHDKICYKLKVEGIDEATMAHIHKGATGVAGGVMVKLEPPAKGFSSNCTQIPPELTEGLMKTPGDYYVNVHNAAFPNGAIRGQVSK